RPGRNATRGPRLFRALLVAILFSIVSVHAQETPPNPQAPPVPEDLPGQVVANPTAPCVQPPPMVSWTDYNGPLHKVVGAFTRKLDRQSVHPPQYKPGLVLCSLETKD